MLGGEREALDRASWRHSFVASLKWQSKAGKKYPNGCWREVIANIPQGANLRTTFRIIMYFSLNYLIRPLLRRLIPICNDLAK